MSDHQKSTVEILKQISNGQKIDLNELESSLKEAKEAAARFISKHPLTSVALAVGVGYFVGKLFSQRRN